MKPLFKIFRVIALVAAVAALFAAQTPVLAQAVVFGDNFDRTDSSTIGNGWIVSPSGGGGPYGGGSIPSAIISGDQVQMNRNGWGDQMSVGISHTFAAATTVQADLSYASVTDGCTAWLGAVSASGAYVDVMSYDDPNVGPCVSVALSSDGGWHDWSTLSQPFGGYNGTATYQIATDGTGTVTVNVIAGGSMQWSRAFSLNVPAFVSGGVTAEWNTPVAPGWVAGTAVYADNFAATSVPEPSSLLALVCLAPLALIRRRK